MVRPPLSSPSLSRVAVVAALSLLGAEALRSEGKEGDPGAGDRGAEILEELPREFFRWRDARGYSWQASGNGALTSGESRYLQSGLNLVVDGEPFAPKAGSRRRLGSGEGPAGLTLREVRGDLGIVRDLRFDRERAAVRTFDSIANTGDEVHRVRVELRTTFPVGWQSLHGAEGRRLSPASSPRLAERERGLAIRFGPSEGRHDTLVLVGGRGGRQPTLRASANRRVLTLAHELEIPAGQTRSVLHWLLQRNLADAADAEGAFAELAPRGRLLRPGVERERLERAVNFGPESFPDAERPPPGQLRALVALHDLLGDLGMHRGGEDLLRLSASNRLAGEAAVSGPLTIHSAPLGERTVPLSGVAAIRGGGGVGREPVLFLRDGRVLVGALEAPDLRLLTGPDGEAEALDPAELDLLSLRVEPADGAPPEGTRHFLQLVDGHVLALGENPGTRLAMATARGPDEVPLSEVNELAYLSRPAPGFRLVERDGSRYGAFLPGATLSLRLRLAGGGEVELSTRSLQRLWRAGAAGHTIEPTRERWLDFSELPGDAAPESGVLLSGNTVLAGTLDGVSLVLEEDGESVRVPVSRIASIRRSLETTEDGRAAFEVNLHEGEILEGAIASSYLTLAHRRDEVVFPAGRLRAYRTASPGP